MPSEMTSKATEMVLNDSKMCATVTELGESGVTTSEEKLAENIQLATDDAHRKQLKESTNIRTAILLASSLDIDTLPEMEKSRVNSEGETLNLSVVPDIDIIDQENDANASQRYWDSSTALAAIDMEHCIISKEGGIIPAIFQDSSSVKNNTEEIITRNTKEVIAEDTELRITDTIDSAASIIECIESKFVAVGSDDVMGAGENETEMVLEVVDIKCAGDGNGTYDFSSPSIINVSETVSCAEDLITALVITKSSNEHNIDTEHETDTKLSIDTRHSTDMKCAIDTVSYERLQSSTVSENITLTFDHPEHKEILFEISVQHSPGMTKEFDNTGDAKSETNMTEDVVTFKHGEGESEGEIDVRWETKRSEAEERVGYVMYEEKKEFCNQNAAEEEIIGLVEEIDEGNSRGGEVEEEIRGLEEEIDEAKNTGEEEEEEIGGLEEEKDEAKNTGEEEEEEIRGLEEGKDVVKNTGEEEDEVKSRGGEVEEEIRGLEEKKDEAKNKAEEEDEGKSRGGEEEEKDEAKNKAEEEDEGKSRGGEEEEKDEGKNKAEEEDEEKRGREKEDEELVVTPVRIRKEFSSSTASVNIFASALARAAGVKRSDLHEQSSRKESLKIERNERAEKEKVERAKKEKIEKIEKDLLEKKVTVKYEKERMLKMERNQENMKETAKGERQAKISSIREEAPKIFEPKSQRLGTISKENIHITNSLNGNRRDRDSRDRSNGYNYSPNASRNIHSDNLINMPPSQNRLQHQMSGVERISGDKGGLGQQDNIFNDKSNQKYNNFNGRISTGNEKTKMPQRILEVGSGTLSGKFQHLMGDNNVDCVDDDNGNNYGNHDGNRNKKKGSDGHENDYNTNKNDRDDDDSENDDNDIYDNNFGQTDHAVKGHKNDYSTSSNNYNSNNSHNNNYQFNNNGDNNNNNNNNNNNSKKPTIAGRSVSTDENSRAYTPSKLHNHNESTKSSIDSIKIDYGHFPSSARGISSNSNKGNYNSNISSNEKNSSHNYNYNIHSNSNDNSSTRNQSSGNIIDKKDSTSHGNDYNASRNHNSYNNNSSSSSNIKNGEIGNDSSSNSNTPKNAVKGHKNDYSTSFNSYDSNNNHNNNNQYNNNRDNNSNSSNIVGLKIDQVSDVSIISCGNYDHIDGSKGIKVSGSSHRNDYSNDDRKWAILQHSDRQNNLQNLPSRQQLDNSNSGGSKYNKNASENAGNKRSDNSDYRKHGEASYSQADKSPSNKYQSNLSHSTSYKSSSFSTASATPMSKKNVNVVTTTPPNADAYAEFMSTITAKKEKDKERDKKKKRSTNWADEDDSDDENEN